MSCDICGKTSPTSLTRIEGVAYQACEACARHGEPIKTVTRRKRASAHNPDEHLVLRADAPKILRDARSLSGKTQSELAKQLGVKESVWQAWESGSRSPTISLARRVEKHLSISLLEEDTNEQVNQPVRSGGGGITIGDLLKKK